MAAEPSRKPVLIEMPLRKVETTDFDPEPIGTAKKKGPRVLQATEDWATETWCKGTSVVTIRRDLNLSIPITESIIRDGLRKRGLSIGRKAA